MYLCDRDPVDVDNIIKPIQDALDGLIYEGDAKVTDVESHRRSLRDVFDVVRLPELLLVGLESAQECVYIAVSESHPLEDYL